jgi:hypothetical protein
MSPDQGNGHFYSEVALRSSCGPKINPDCLHHGKVTVMEFVGLWLHEADE